MRDALKESIAATRGQAVEGYPRGSIVLCVSCGKPLFRLDEGLVLGEHAGRAARKFAPVAPRDLVALVDRVDVHAGLRAWIKDQTWPQLMTYCELIPHPRAGDLCLCPQCGHGWVEGRTAEVSDTVDRAYVLELHVIPPDGRAAPTHRRPGASPFLR